MARDKVGGTLSEIERTSAGKLIQKMDSSVRGVSLRSTYSVSELSACNMC